MIVLRNKNNFSERSFALIPVCKSLNPNKVAPIPMTTLKKIKPQNMSLTQYYRELKAGNGGWNAALRGGQPPLEELSPVVRTAGYQHPTPEMKNAVLNAAKENASKPFVGTAGYTG